MSGDRWRDANRGWKRLEVWLDDKLTGPGSRDREPEAVDALGDVGQVRRMLDEVEMRAVRSARLRGRSWAEIATRLGVTRQSAWEKWRDLDEPRAAEAGAVTGAEPVTGADAGTGAESVTGAESGAVPIARRAPARSVRVPDVVGLRLELAISALRRRGLVAVGSDPEVPLGTLDLPGSMVTDQSPESGASVPAGSRVVLWADSGEGGVREPRRPRPDPLPAHKHVPDPLTEAATAR